jgi:hypothetical protein
MKRRLSLVPLVALGFALARATQAQPPQAEPTALNLAAKGDAYVSIQSRDRIVRIVSDKSVASLAPNVWHVVYYDPDFPLHCIEVKFGGGQEMDVSHPMRPFQLPATGGSILDKARLKVDSDQAVNIAAAQPLLKPLTLRATKLTLTQGDVGPVWKVQFWAAKLSEPAREAEVGTVTLSADDGSILKSDLHPGHAN